MARSSAARGDNEPGRWGSSAKARATRFQPGNKAALGNKTGQVKRTLEDKARILADNSRGATSRRYTPPPGGGSVFIRDKKSRLAAGIAAALDIAGVTPIEFLLTEMANPKNGKRLRIHCAEAAAPYCHSKMPIGVLVADGNNLAGAQQRQQELRRRVATLLGAADVLEQLEGKGVTLEHKA